MSIKMNINGYANAVKEIIEKRFPEYKVKVQEVQKVNECLTGITILSGTSNVSPNIYLDLMYKNNVSIDEAVEHVLEMYEKHKKDSIDVSGILNLEYIKENIFCQLINKHKNIEMLKDIPHRDVTEDLTIIYRVSLEINNYNVASMIITNEHISLLNISDEVFNSALENTARLLPLSIRTLHEVIMEMMGLTEEDLESMEANRDINVPQMYYISNEKKVNGAISILYPNVLRNFAKSLGVEKLVVLPSSTQECIVLPYDESMDMEIFRNMVKEVNAEAVTTAELLSDNAYLYEVDSDSIKIA